MRHITTRSATTRPATADVSAAPRRGGLSRAVAALLALVAVLAGAPAAQAAGGAAPFGAVDRVSTTSAGVSVSGWAIDPDTRDPIAVHVYVGARGVAIGADRARADVGAVYRLGDRHGYEASVPAAPGQHTVCVYAINDGPGANTQLGCRDVTVANAAPFGAVDNVAASRGSVSVSGWALDPDTHEPIAVHVYVGAKGVAAGADRVRADVGAAFRKGDRHGYEVAVPAAPGRHAVCVYAINDRPGANAALGCRDVTVVDAVPFGAVDRVTGSADGVSVAGWAVDPDTHDPISVHVYVGGRGVAVRADRPRADVAAAVRLGDRHGYETLIPAAPGRYSVCLYAINDRPGANTLLGCRPVTVGASTGSGAYAGQPRSPALHPFASSSVWNRGMGSAATFEPAGGPRTAAFLSTTPFVNRTDWSIPVFQARAGDPVVRLESVRDRRSYSMAMPTGTVTAGGTDGHATVVTPDGATAYDMYKLVKVNAGLWRAQSVVVTDLRGSGTGAGVRAAAVPGLAGLIRAHELRAGHIPHALAVAVPNSVLRSGHVWPATRQDSDGATAYRGTVPMGTLFAIPPSVDVERMPLSPEGRALARALQDYGAYVVDRAGAAALYCELACDAAGTNRLITDWRTLYREMRAVTNSSAATVGGGGTPLVPPAAPLS